MSIEDIKRSAGEKPFMIWLPADLHAAVKGKLAKDRKTAKAVVTRFLELYSGYKVEKNVAVESPGKNEGD